MWYLLCLNANNDYLLKSKISDDILIVTIYYIYTDIFVLSLVYLYLYFQAAAALKVGDRSRITDDKLWNRDTGLRQKRGSAGAVVGQSTNQTQPTVFRFDTRRESKISIPAGKVYIDYH